MSRYIYIYIFTASGTAGFLAAPVVAGLGSGGFLAPPLGGGLLPAGSRPFLTFILLPARFPAV